MPYLNKFVALGKRKPRTGGFTLVETLVVSGLLVTIIASALAVTVEMEISSSRSAECNAVMAVVEAKAQDIRAFSYNPPAYPFSSNTVYYTNSEKIDLDQAGAKFLIPGTVITKVEPAGSLGHLITVTGTFQTTRRGLTQTVQTVVNTFSGGQQ
jgi:type II secretory pathway pseudopilin PulG